MCVNSIGGSFGRTCCGFNTENLGCVCEGHVARIVEIKCGSCMASPGVKGEQPGSFSHSCGTRLD